MLSAALDLVAPPYCAFCRQPISRHATGACDGCLADLPWASDPNVRIDSPVVSALAPLNYRFPIDVAIRAWKFERRRFYTPVFIDILVEAAMDLDETIDAVVAVPLHWRRLAYRGFNQAELLARPLSRVLALPLIRSLRRRRATPTQSGLTADARRANLKRAFVNQRPIAAKHVLIVDDVVTTGGTVTEVAKTLRAAGVARISVLALAQTPVR